MIQDIFPHNFDIAYKNENPDLDSRIVFLSEGKIYVIENVDAIDFPSYSQLINKPGEEQLQYVFALDGTKYFRFHIESIEHLSEYYVHTDNKAAVEETEARSGIWKTRHELRPVRPKEMTLAAVTAMHLDGWYESSKYCGRCGQKTVHDDKERVMRCPSCGNMIFPRINPAVIVAVTNGDKLLLTKYKGREYKNYALVAGFTEIGESFEETVKREVMEEAGLKVKNITYYKSQPWGFADNILAGYFCQVDGDTEIKMDKDELSVAEWVGRDEIPAIIEELSLTNEMIQKFKVDKGN